MLNKRCCGRKALKREILAKIILQNGLQNNRRVNSNTSRSKDTHIGHYGAPGGFYSSLNFLPVNFYVVLKLDHLHYCCENAINLKNH